MKKAFIATLTFVALTTVAAPITYKYKCPCCGKMIQLDISAVPENPPAKPAAPAAKPAPVEAKKPEPPKAPAKPEVKPEPKKVEPPKPAPKHVPSKEENDAIAKARKLAKMNLNNDTRRNGVNRIVAKADKGEALTPGDIGWINGIDKTVAKEQEDAKKAEAKKAEAKKEAPKPPVKPAELAKKPEPPKAK